MTAHALGDLIGTLIQLFVDDGGMAGDDFANARKHAPPPTACSRHRTSVAEVWFSSAQTGNQTEKKTGGTRLAVHSFPSLVPGLPGLHVVWAGHAEGLCPYPVNRWSWSVCLDNNHHPRKTLLYRLRHGSASVSNTCLVLSVFFLAQLFCSCSNPRYDLCLNKLNSSKALLWSSTCLMVDAGSREEAHYRLWTEWGSREQRL